METLGVDLGYSAYDASSHDTLGPGNGSTIPLHWPGPSGVPSMDSSRWKTEADLTTASVLTSNTSTPPNSTFDVEKLLETYLGPRHRSLLEWVILTMVYSAIFLTGIVGNVSTCIVIAKNTYMHTATNYYLFSLAISDVLTLILGKYIILIEDVHLSCFLQVYVMFP